MNRNLGHFVRLLSAPVGCGHIGLVFKRDVLQDYFIVARKVKGESQETKAPFTPFFRL